MQSVNLVSSFAEIAREKDIDRDALQLIVQDVFRAMIKKRYGADDSFHVIFNPDNGDIEILHERTVVANYAVEDPVTEIELRNARTIDEDAEEGDDVAVQVPIHDFGRRAVMTARQTFAQRIRDIEKENTFEEYAERVGEVIIGEVYQSRRKEVLVLHDRTELLLPKEEQIPRDRYRKDLVVRAIIKEVRRDEAGNPQIIISRTDPEFMRRLFEMEVPEVEDGIVEIRQIVREPGDRAKITVYSNDDRVDPVGACVGPRGMRIHKVAHELCNEGIDVIPWTNKPEEMIKRSLAPAKPVSVELSTDSRGQKRAKVVVRADEVSQAIGRGGINIRLAIKLTGYEIDIFREVTGQEEDIDLREFADELPAELIERFYEVGIDSGRSLLSLSADELARRTGLTVAEAEGVQRLIRNEFDEDAG